MLKEGFLFTFISAFMALFPVANPVGAGFLVNGLLSGLDDEDRKSIIRRIITDYLLVGLGSLAVGHFVLTLFGLSLPVIQLGGGLLICRTALQWLSDSDSSVGHAQGKDVNPLHKIALESQVFYPITFPISIGPGSVSVILTLMASVSMKDGWAKGLLSYAIIALVIVLMCLILYLFLSQGERIIRKIGTSGSIVICGQQKDVVDKALEIGASCVIICQGSLSEKYLGLSSKTCIIATPCDAYRAARMIYQAIPVQRIAQHTGVVLFHLNDFIDDVRETVLQSRYRSYPVLDENEKVVGTLSRYHLLRPRRKRVVLVDHNEKSQSIPGLEQADIIAIIDHHRLADIQTGAPVFMRNEPVGSTTTIVATMFQERGLQPSEKMAGLMVAAILSDTVMFKSPTCTPRDRRMAERLARIAGIDLETLGREMFSAGSGADKPVEQLLNTDFKEFHIAGHNLGICQITCLDTDRMLERLPEILPEMQKIKDNKGYDMFLMMLTDVLRCGTELVFLGGDDAVRQAFNLNEDTSSHHVWLPKVVSRKKQIVPALALLWG